MLVKQADIALHQAKQQKTPYIVFDGKMQKQAMQDLTLSKKLKIAIESNIIDVFYQPKIDLYTKKIVGMEALARWKDEQGKFIPPGVFIPLAEKNGLINHLFQIIVAKTIKDMARIFLPIQPQIMVSINLSAHQFEIQDLVQEITCRVDHENIPRERFEFEVTESVFIANMEKTRATLQQFKQEGFQLSLDDFGTGFSSLTYLNYLPFDTLKIDKSFVDPVPQDSRMNALTRSIINLSHAINLHCVAEGVESKDQMEFLAELGCDFCQGYFYSPPVHRDAFEQLLRKQNA
jgi:EAL domain-containing protein (putative c-di-GMP-specific phosphodiesterase class I)